MPKAESLFTTESSNDEPGGAVELATEDYPPVPTQRNLQMSAGSARRMDKRVVLSTPTDRDPGGRQHGWQVPASAVPVGVDACLDSCGREVHAKNAPDSRFE